MTIVVTGATGHLGRLTIEGLLARGVPAADIVATAKDINEERAAKEDVIIEDAAEETTEAAAEEEADA